MPETAHRHAEMKANASLAFQRPQMESGAPKMSSKKPDASHGIWLSRKSTRTPNEANQARERMKSTGFLAC